MNNILRFPGQRPAPTWREYQRAQPLTSLNILHTTLWVCLTGALCWLVLVLSVVELSR
jgi:hypothetical protein